MMPIEETVSRLKTYATAFWGKNSENYVEIVEDLIQCLGVQHVVDTPFPAIPLRFFSSEIRDSSLTSMENVSIRIFPEWGKEIQRLMGPECAG